MVSREESLDQVGALPGAAAGGLATWSHLAAKSRLVARDAWRQCVRACVRASVRLSGMRGRRASGPLVVNSEHCNP